MELVIIVKTQGNVISKHITKYLRYLVAKPINFYVFLSLTILWVNLQDLNEKLNYDTIFHHQIPTGYRDNPMGIQR